MRSLAILALAGFAELVHPIHVDAQPSPTSGQAAAVYELFTSQGCSNCPAADAILGRLSKRTDIIALTFPVDIWDYLGWRDTLARPEFSDRQQAYARVLGDGMVYTPQAVVNGLVQVNGGSDDRVARAIEKAGKLFAAARVPVSLSSADGRLVIDIAAAPNGAAVKEATVWLAAITSHVKVPVGRGENKGRTLAYSNVVSRLMPIGTWDGTEMVVHIDRRSFLYGNADRCAVLLQQGRGGPIVGAALIGGI
jgi:hypothetical protein